MSKVAGAAHGDTDPHAEHWGWSVWPFAVSMGILALVFAFGFWFVYHMQFAATIALGVGVVLVIASVAGWTSEAMGHGEGLSYGAMGWFILAEAMIFVSSSCRTGSCGCRRPTGRRRTRPSFPRACRW